MLSGEFDTSKRFEDEEGEDHIGLTREGAP